MDLRMQQITSAQAMPVNPKQAGKTSVKATKDFSEVLQAQQAPKISKHAELRMKERAIKVDDEKWQEISSKMQEAKSKGITDSLILTDKAAFVVSIKNNTVVTAMNRDEADNQVFTNINGTIVMK